MVFRKIIDSVLYTTRGKVIFVASVFVVLSISAVVLYILSRPPINDDYTKTDTSGLYDKGGKLIDAVGIDTFAAISDQLSNFLEGQNLERSATINIDNVVDILRTYDVDFYISIPELNKENVLVKVYYDYNVEQAFIEIPDYNFKSIISTGGLYGDT